MSKNRNLQKTIGSFAVSGKSIYTLNEIDESLEFKAPYGGMNFTIRIDKETGADINLSTDFKNEENDIS